MNEIKQSFTTLNQWLNWLEITRPETDIKMGLDRTYKVGKAANVLQPAPFIITVAGTNGKGSTVALLESVLTKAGYNVGSYTSPHIQKFNERIKINGQPAQDQQLCDAFSYIDSCRSETWLTYFEFAVLVAAHCFQKNAVDIVIMEVGLGGRLDASNVIDPNIAVITTIDFDHQDFLGNTLEAIATEKAGIMRSKTPVVFGDKNMPNAIANRAKQLQAPLYKNGIDFNWQEQDEHTWHWQGHDIHNNHIELKKLPKPDLVTDNAATMLQVIHLTPFNVSEEILRSAIKETKLQGRFTRTWHKNDSKQNIEIIYDVGHNPQAVLFLSKKLKQIQVKGKLFALIAIFKDKDYPTITTTLAPFIDHWFITELDSPRALSSEKLLDNIQKLSDCAEIIQRNHISSILNKLSSEDKLLVIGSFHTVELAINAFESKKTL